MIDSFQIIVPSTIEVGQTFQITVIALNALGEVVADDSSTVVEITSSDLDLLYDGDEDTNFELLDNQKTLVNGVAVFDVFDNKAPEVTIDADNSPDGPVTLTGSKTISYGFNALPLVQLDYAPVGKSTEAAPRFFDPRDTVAVVTSYQKPPESETAHTQELRDLLPVTIVP